MMNAQGDPKVGSSMAPSTRDPWIVAAAAASVGSGAYGAVNRSSATSLLSLVVIRHYVPRYVSSATCSIQVTDVPSTVSAMAMCAIA